MLDRVPSFIADRNLGLFSEFAYLNGQLTSARGLYLVADEMLTLIGGDLEGNKPTPIKEASFRLWEDKLTLSQEDPQDNEWQLFVFERRA